MEKLVPQGIRAQGKLFRVSKNTGKRGRAAGA